jgi:hypothetical protein
VEHEGTFDIGGGRFNIEHAEEEPEIAGGERGDRRGDLLSRESKKRTADHADYADQAGG